MTSTVIIGAGISGLAAAYRSRSLSNDTRIFEAESGPGGLLSPLNINGFTFDFAVHLSFALEHEVRSIFDQTSYLTHVPESLCWDNGYWLRHPVQNNMFPLPLDQKVDLIAGLITSPTGEIKNYYDWLVQQYGVAIAERWPIAYTKKYWTVPAEKLGINWIGQRMRKADIKEVLSGAISPQTTNQYYVKEMRYPVQGGYFSFLRPLIEGAIIECDRRAVGVDPINRKVYFDTGNDVSYENLISTIPLPKLIDCLPNVPPQIRSDASSLFATSIDLISVGFKRPNVSPALWFYIYDDEILSARAYSPDWKSPNNVPDGCSALQFEIYSSREKPQNHSIDEIKKNTLYALMKMGLCSEDDVLFMEHNYVPYANVVFDLGMEERRDRVIEYVKSLDIKLAGRFGTWEYLWSNQAFMSGYGLFDRDWARDI